jgi:hypothetical protein
MTTYFHTLTIGDSEYIALSAALNLMIQHCDQQLADGPKAPYWAHRQSCIKMLEKLRNGTPVMASTSSWCRPKIGE